MSRAEVRAFVTKKREQYAARYTAGEVEAPPLPVTRACKRSKTQATPRTKQPDQLDGIGEESPESPDDCRDPDYVLDAGDDIASADEDISADDEAACVSPPAEVLTCSTDKEARHYFGISESSDDEGQQPPTQSNLQLDQTERLQIEHPENRQGGQQETLHLDHPEKLQGALPMSVQNGLPEKINATLSRLGSDFYVFVRPTGEHNHPLSNELWDYYAENRTIQDPMLLSTMEEMRSAGSSSKGILAWLRKKTGKKTKLKDVHNLLQGLKRSEKGDRSDAQRTETILEEFVSMESGNSARVFVDKKRDIAVAVVFQTAGMKRLFSAFPEVLLVDTTHDTNAHAYKLFSFVVQDCFGKGQYIQHALVERETKENLRLVLQTFVASNPSYNGVEVLMTDKAFHEKAVLAEVFTSARQLLCQFHVQQWFAKQVARLDKGTTEEKAVIEASMGQMIDSASAKEYEDQKSLLLDLLKATASILSLRLSWRTGTANKRTLIMLQEWAEDEYIEEYNKVGSRPLIDEHKEISSLAGAVSSFALNLVSGELHYALGDAEYEIDRGDHYTTLRILRTRTKHTLNTKLIPQVPANNNESMLPPLPSFSTRWLRRHPANNIKAGPVSSGSFELHEVQASKPIAHVRREAKYIQAKSLTESIVAAMSRQPTPMFHAALRWLKDFDTALQDGTLENFTGIVERSSNDSERSVGAASITSEVKLLEEKAPVSRINVSGPAVERVEQTAYKFSKPVKNKKLSKKKIDRAQRKFVLRQLAKLCGTNPLRSGVTATQINLLLSGGYCYEEAAQPLSNYNPPTCDVAINPTIRLMSDEEKLTLEEVVKVLPQDIVTYALSMLASQRGTSGKKFVACWSEFGAASQEQLAFMVLHAEAKQHIEAVEHTLEWIAAVAWPSSEDHTLPKIFRDLLPEQKALNLCLSVIGSEAIDGFRLLSFRRCQWLSTTSIITAMHALAIKYGETGVVSPSFAGMKEPDRKRKVANAYNAFSGTNTEIIGVLNIGGVHWVAYHIDVRAQTCRIFDPQQGTASYNELEAAVKEVVEPLLSLNSELIYYKFTSCLQEDNDNCGLWCLVILELTLGRTPWNKVLYELVPYLRLRYLGMCTSYIEEQRGGR
ncbi:MULE transposase domain-containing protein [Phytophthora infestans]|uniref:MULE transposase domain-containing protein n=1 Tax=Phytophthora infestans TaxID=4787 RepID=A0A8S9V9G4_PHYIN|nr:MULE transposase domain-containing protein [Phytophthora infestans]